MDKDKAALLERLRYKIAMQLVDIETLCDQCGLPMSALTLVARDPANDEMSVVVTNDSLPEVRRLIALREK